MVHKDEWYCSICGSTDVEIKTWQKANGHDSFNGDYINSEDCWCCDCENHTYLEIAIEDFLFENRME